MEEFLVNETNRYAKENKNKPDFSISMEEMMQFIGLIFLSIGAQTRIYDVMLFAQLWVEIALVK